MAEMISAYFKSHPRLNKAQTEKEGRPIYDDQIVCEMRIPGDTNRVVVQPANATKWIDGPGGVRIQQSFKERFSDQWKQFEAKLPQSVSGTPLSELPFLTEGKRKSFRAVGVLTAEQLASLEGTQLKALGQDGRDFKEQAQRYLDLAAGVSNNAELETKIAEQAKQIADLQAMMAKGAAPAAAPTLEPKPVAADASPFDDYEADDIKLWLKDAAPDLAIDGRWGKAKLIEVADEVNANLAKSKRVA